MATRRRGRLGDMPAGDAPDGNRLRRVDSAHHVIGSDGGRGPPSGADRQRPRAVPTLPDYPMAAPRRGEFGRILDDPAVGYGRQLAEPFQLRLVGPEDPPAFHGRLPRVKPTLTGPSCELSRRHRE